MTLACFFWSHFLLQRIQQPDYGLSKHSHVGTETPFSQDLCAAQALTDKAQAQAAGESLR